MASVYMLQGASGRYYIGATEDLDQRNIRGDGSHGLRTSRWEGENIKVEVFVDNTLADARGEHLAMISRNTRWNCESD